MINKSLFLKTSSINILLKFATVGMIFIFQSMLSKIVSVEAYSVYAKFTMYSGYMALFLSFGMSSSLLYFSKNEIEFKENYVGAFLLYLTMGAIVISSIFVVPQKNILYILIILFGILLNLIGVSLSYYQFQKEFTKYAIFSFYQSLCVVSVLVFIEIFNLTNMLSILKVYIFIHLIFFLILSFKIFFRKMNTIPNKVSLKSKIIQYGLKTVGLLLLTQFIYLADFIMVDYYLEDRQVTYYFVALIFSKIIFIMADTIGSIVFTLYAQAKVGEKQKINQNVYLVSSILFVLSILFFILFYIFGESILRSVYTASYSDAYMSALILISGTQGMIIYKFLSRKLAAENSWSLLYYTVIVAAVTNVILNLILIPRYGIEGAAISSMLAYWTCGVTLSLLHKEKLSNFLFYFKQIKV